MIVGAITIATTSNVMKPTTSDAFFIYYPLVGASIVSHSRYYCSYFLILSGDSQQCSLQHPCMFSYSLPRLRLYAACAYVGCPIPHGQMYSMIPRSSLQFNGYSTSAGCLLLWTSQYSPQLLTSWRLVSRTLGFALDTTHHPVSLSCLRIIAHYFPNLVPLYQALHFPRDSEICSSACKSPV